MGRRILRRILAAQDAENIANYIARDRLEAALRFLENAESTLKELALAPGGSNPFLTDQPELANLRYRRVAGFPQHLIFFIEHPTAIEVVRILHGARNLDVELRKHGEPRA